MLQKPLLLLSLSLMCLPALSAQSISPQPVQRRMLTETSRAANQIKADFPYDIDLKDANGKVIKSSKLFKKTKKPTVLLFWLTTCGPCKMELTAIAQKFTDWKKTVDFDFYAISTDYSDRAEQFNTRVKESNWPFPAYWDMNREFRFVMPGELNGLPQLFVLDSDGKIGYHTRKYMPGDEDKLLEALKAL